MKVVQDERTTGVKTMVSMENGKVLIGHKDGMISMWQYDGPRKDLQHLSNYYPCSNEGAVTHLSNVSQTHFVSINDRLDIFLWNKMSRTSSSFNVSEIIKKMSNAILLPNNLIAIAASGQRDFDDRDLMFWIWDVDQNLDFGKCIFQDQNRLWRPRLVNLAISAQGYLIVCGDCHSAISIWQINRLDCTKIYEGGGDRIYSMACLPTGEVVTGNHNLDFYRVSGDSIECLEEDIIDNRNVVDFIHPVGGYKLFVCHRARGADAFRLWDSITKKDRSFGWTSPSGSEYSSDIIVLEKDDAVLNLTQKEDKIIIHDFEQGIFSFPKNLAEIRKISRVLFQAHQMESNHFSKLPTEIIMKIILLTPDYLTENEKKVSFRLATNYFCYPSVRDELNNYTSDL